MTERLAARVSRFEQRTQGPELRLLRERVHGIAQRLGVPMSGAEVDAMARHHIRTPERIKQLHETGHSADAIVERLTKELLR